MDFDFDLQGHNHEEADTLIILHSFQIAKIHPFREVVFVHSDTDVLLMLLWHYQTLWTQTIIRVGRVDRKRDINIGKSFEVLRDAKSQALVGFYAFIGCNQTSKFNDYAKQSCWSTFITSPKKIIDAFTLPGNSIKHSMEECIDDIIKFVLNLYCKNFQQISTTFQSYGGICFQKSSLNQMRYHQHFQRSSISYIKVIT